jgi:hypothetical protein
LCHTTTTLCHTTTTLHHTTQVHDYVDDLHFALAPAPPGCKVLASSQSRALSIIDFSTNYCNIHNLLWGASGGVQETLGECKEHDASKCAKY